MKDRKEILAQAQSFVGDKGEVRDYQSSCHPGGERFIVNWFNSKFPVCYSLDELKLADELKNKR